MPRTRRGSARAYRGTAFYLLWTCLKCPIRPVRTARRAVPVGATRRGARLPPKLRDDQRADGDKRPYDLSRQSASRSPHDFETILRIIFFHEEPMPRPVDLRKRFARVTCVDTVDPCRYYQERAAQGSQRPPGVFLAKLRKLAKFCKFLQIFGGLVLGCIKTKFCKKICV